MKSYFDLSRCQSAAKHEQRTWGEGFITVSPSLPPFTLLSVAAPTISFRFGKLGAGCRFLCGEVAYLHARICPIPQLAVVDGERSRVNLEP